MHKCHCTGCLLPTQEQAADTRYFCCSRTMLLADGRLIVTFTFLFHCCHHCCCLHCCPCPDPHHCCCCCCCFCHWQLLVNCQLLPLKYFKFWFCCCIAALLQMVLGPFLLLENSGWLLLLWFSLLLPLLSPSWCWQAMAPHCFCCHQLIATSPIFKCFCCCHCWAGLLSIVPPAPCCLLMLVDCCF